MLSIKTLNSSSSKNIKYSYSIKYKVVFGNDNVNLLAISSLNTFLASGSPARNSSLSNGNDKLLCIILVS